MTNEVNRAKFEIGNKFTEIDNASTSYITILNVSPEKDSYGSINYFTKVLCVPEPVTGVTDRVLIYDVYPEEYLEDLEGLYKRG